jgi:hypothetical protein
MEVKLCRGGGLEVAHSRERPQPQGSSTSTFGLLRARMTLRMKGKDHFGPSLERLMVQTCREPEKLKPLPDGFPGVV